MSKLWVIVIFVIALVVVSFVMKDKIDLAPAKERDNRNDNAKKIPMTNMEKMIVASSHSATTLTLAQAYSLTSGRKLDTRSQQFSAELTKSTKF